MVEALKDPVAHA